MEMEQEAGGGEAGGAWPAFADLLAATTLLFLILFAAVAVPAIRRAGQADAQKNTLRRIQAQLDSAQRDTAVSVLRVGDYLLVRIEGEATFPQDRFELGDLKPAGKRILREFGQVLLRDTLLRAIDQVQVVGHTSSEGGEGHNWRLSASRAATVSQFLIDSVHVPPCQVSALGRSRYYPVNPGHARATDEVDAQDRRIELEIRPVLPSDSVQKARRNSCVARRGRG